MRIHGSAGSAENGLPTSTAHSRTGAMDVTEGSGVEVRGLHLWADPVSKVHGHYIWGVDPGSLTEAFRAVAKRHQAR